MRLLSFLTLNILIHSFYLLNAQYDTLKYLINPATPESFLKNHVEAQKPAHFSRKDPEYYRDLLSIHDLDLVLLSSVSASNESECEGVMEFNYDYKILKRVFQNGEYWSGTFQMPDKCNLDLG